MGLPAAQSGKIVQKGEAGLRNSIDVAGYCVKHGGPLTGFGLGITVFSDSWREILFTSTGTAGAQWSPAFCWCLSG